MHVLVTDFGVRHGALAGRLASAGLDVGLASPGRPLIRIPATGASRDLGASESSGLASGSLPTGQPSIPRPGFVIAALSPGDDIARLRELQECPTAWPLVVVVRAAILGQGQAEELGLTVMFPGVDAGGALEALERHRGVVGLPGTVVGPLAGRPRRVDRWLAVVLRKAGIRASCRGDMYSWLTVTSAWLSPLRGAVIAAARQGLPLRAAPDLVTLATRAARERLLLLRSCGFDLDARSACLVALPEGWAIKAMRRIAEALPRDGDPWCLPTADEAVAVSRSQASLARDAGVRTPAADFLDTFSSEEATREPHGRDTPKPGETSSSSNPERLDRYAALASKAWPPP